VLHTRFGSSERTVSFIHDPHKGRSGESTFNSNAKSRHVSNHTPIRELSVPYKATRFHLLRSVTHASNVQMVIAK
jgi:hypothetical protein